MESGHVAKGMGPVVQRQSQVKEVSSPKDKAIIEISPHGEGRPE